MSTTDYTLTPLPPEVDLAYDGTGYYSGRCMIDYGHAVAAPLLSRIAELEQQRAALVEALLVLKREVHGGPLQAWRKADAALRAAGVATEGGLGELL